MFRSVAAACALSIALVASIGSAQSAYGTEAPLAGVAPSGWLARPLVVEGQFGGGAPLGTTGVALEYTPIAWATFSGGVGLAQGHPQAAFVPRVHQPLTDTLGIGVGAGISVGPSGTDGRDAMRRLFCSSCGDVPERTYGFAWWINGEVSLEERRPWGLVWRIFVGGARVLDPNEGSCGAASCVDHQWVLYSGAGVGWSFSI